MKKFFEVELVQLSETPLRGSRTVQRWWGSSTEETVTWVKAVEPAGRLLMATSSLGALKLLNYGEHSYGVVYDNEGTYRCNISRSSYDALREELLKESGL